MRHIIIIFNPICIFKFSFKLTLTSFKFFYCVFKTRIVYLIYFIIIKFRLNIFMCFLISTYFLFLCSRISYTALLTIALFSFCLLNFLLGTLSFLRSLVGIILTSLEPKSPSTLHSSDECPGQCIRQVFTYPEVSLNIFF